MPQESPPRLKRGLSPCQGLLQGIQLLEAKPKSGPFQQGLILWKMTDPESGLSFQPGAAGGVPARQVPGLEAICMVQDRLLDEASQEGTGQLRSAGIDGKQPSHSNGLCTAWRRHIRIDQTGAPLQDSRLAGQKPFLPHFDRVPAIGLVEIEGLGLAGGILQANPKKRPFSLKPLERHLLHPRPDHGRSLPGQGLEGHRGPAILVSPRQVFQEGGHSGQTEGGEGGGPARAHPLQVREWRIRGQGSCPTRLLACSARGLLHVFLPEGGCAWPGPGNAGGGPPCARGGIVLPLDTRGKSYLLRMTRNQT